MNRFLDNTPLVLTVIGLVGVGMLAVMVMTSIAESRACAEHGGKMIHKTSSGVGVGVAPSGDIAVVPTTGTVSFCVSADGRILW